MDFQEGLHERCNPAPRTGRIEGQVPLEERTPLAPRELERMNAYWRAANYLSVGQIYLKDNPLLRRPLARPTSRPGSSAIGARARV